MKSTRHLSLASLSLTIALAGTLVACGSTSLTRTGPPQAARASNCEFQVLTAPPNGDYVEVGTVDVSGSSVSDNLSTFKKEIRESVCAAGGDAAIAYANGYGYYIKATVLKGTGRPAPVSLTSAPSGGCTYDTQCKGDRVCVAGACVDPKR